MVTAGGTRRQNFRRKTRESCAPGPRGRRAAVVSGGPGRAGAGSRAPGQPARRWAPTRTRPASPRRNGSSGFARGPGSNARSQPGPEGPRKQAPHGPVQPPGLRTPDRGRSPHGAIVIVTAGEIDWIPCGASGLRVTNAVCIRKPTSAASGGTWIAAPAPPWLSIRPRHPRRADFAANLHRRPDQIRTVPGPLRRDPAVRRPRGKLPLSGRIRTLVLPGRFAARRASGVARSTCGSLLAVGRSEPRRTARALLARGTVGRSFCSASGR